MTLAYAMFSSNQRAILRTVGRAPLRIFSTAAAPAAVQQFAVNGVHMPTESQQPVAMRFADSCGPTIDVGFTDNTAFRFDAAWLRSVIAGTAVPVDSAPEVASATMTAGESLHIQWAGDILKASTFDANMLRAYADDVAKPLESPSIEQPFKGPAVWTGKDLAASPWWGHMLSQADIEDLVQATAHAMKTVQWRAPHVPEVMPKEDFPLGPMMTSKLASISAEIEHGMGLAMIRNMPVADPRLTEDDLAVMYVGISAHIGHVVMQSSSGLRSVSRGYGMPLGRIQAEMTGETPKGGLQTNNHFRLHTDRCDVISLLSLRTAPTGGASRVCSVPAVYNALLERRPDLAKALTLPIDRIWEGDKGFFRLPVIGLTPSGQCTSQISPSYVENAQFLEGTEKATPIQIEALDAIEEIGMELGAEFVMQPGMMHFLNNHQVYHGRGNWSVTDGESSGEWGKQGRLLFRTWISPYNSRSLPDTPEYRNIWGNVAGGKPRGGWDQAVKTGDSPKPKIPADHVYYSLYSDKVQKDSMNGHCGTVLQY